MKIVHISSSDSGGAGTSARRLHEGLLMLGVESNLLVLTHKNFTVKNIVKYPSQSEGKFYQKILNRIGFPQTLAQRYWHKVKKLLKIKGDYECLSFAYSQYDVQHHELVQQADVINLHWVAGFIDYERFFKEINKPVIWTLHDKNPFIGCFHYDNDGIENVAFKNICQQDLAVKRNALKHVSNKMITIIAPSKWLLNESLNSEIFTRFEHNHIPYGLNSQIFRVQEQELCRNHLKLPTDKKIFLFVCDNLSIRRKGLSILLNALKSINLDDIILVTAGNTDGLVSEEFISVGKIDTEEEMSKLYGAANAFIIPSLEDNLPNVVLESLCCGTPVIGFNIGGLPEMVNNVNGYLISKTDAISLAEGIKKAFKNIDYFQRDAISQQAINRYDMHIQADKYIDIYNKALSKWNVTIDK